MPGRAAVCAFHAKFLCQLPRWLLDRGYIGVVQGIYREDIEGRHSGYVGTI